MKLSDALLVEIDGVRLIKDGDKLSVIYDVWFDQTAKTVTTDVPGEMFSYLDNTTIEYYLKRAKNTGTDCTEDLTKFLEFTINRYYEHGLCWMSKYDKEIYCNFDKNDLIDDLQFDLGVFNTVIEDYRENEDTGVALYFWMEKLRTKMKAIMLLQHHEMPVKERVAMRVPATCSTLGFKEMHEYLEMEPDLPVQTEEARLKNIEALRARYLSNGKPLNKAQRAALFAEHPDLEM